MRKLDFNEFKSAQFQAHVFESSVEKANFSSKMFIRRFMQSEDALMFYDKTVLIISEDYMNVIDRLNETYKETENFEKYSKDEMYFIGYVYAAICFLYDMTPKMVYKKFNASKIREYYNIYHTFDIEEAAERMMENIGFKKVDYNVKGKKILRELILEENTKKYNKS